MVNYIARYKLFLFASGQGICFILNRGRKMQKNAKKIHKEPNNKKTSNQTTNQPPTPKPQGLNNGEMYWLTMETINTEILAWCQIHYISRHRSSSQTIRKQD